MMTSHLGVSEVAAVGFSGRIVFIMNLALFGIASGGGVIVGQSWGAGKKEGARQSTAISIAMACPFALVFVALCALIPEPMIALATDDASVIGLGAAYLRIAGLMAFPFMIGMVLSVALRCIGLAKISMRLSAIGIGSNLLLNYVLIFGKWGFPALGIVGAAYATLISSVLETACVLVYIYGRKSSLAFALSDFKSGLANGLWRTIGKVAYPLALNGVVWSGGVLIYNIMVGRMGTNELAILSMITPIESLIVALYIGVGTAASVLTAQNLGAGRFEAAWSEGKAFIVWSVLCALLASLLVWGGRGLIVGFYPAIEGEALVSAQQVLTALVFVGGFRSVNIAVIIGMLRSGGDTRFCLGLDIFCQWAVGIVLTYLAAFVWELPLYAVFIAINSEEIVKVFLCLYRFSTRKWLRNLVGAEPG